MHHRGNKQNVDDESCRIVVAFKWVDREQGGETELHLLWSGLNVPPREQEDIGDESCLIVVALNNAI
jgi:hypothetical protein